MSASMSVMWRKSTSETRGNERDSSNKLQWQNAKGGDDIDNPIDYNPKGKVARKAPAGKGLKQPLLDGDDL